MLFFVLFAFFVSPSFSGGKEDVKEHSIQVLVGYQLPPYSYYEWSPSGNLTEANGILPAYLELMSHRFHFKYSFVPLGGGYLVDDRPNEKGLISMLLEKKGDVIIGLLVPTMSRYALADFTMPTSSMSFAILIPKLTVVSDARSLVRPFRLEVWIGLVGSAAGIVIYWYAVTRLKAKPDVFTPVAYTLTVLFSQGNRCQSKQLRIRLVALVWCLAAFVLVPAYSGKLVSFIMAPMQSVLVDSLNDIIDKVPFGLNVAVDRGLGADVYLQNWLALASSGQLNNTLGKLALATSSSIYRCNKTHDCTEKVLDGGHVFLLGEVHAVDEIAVELKRTGECPLSMAREKFNPGFQYWALAKRSHYLAMFNAGILELQAFGLTNYLESHFIARPDRCLARQMKQKRRSLTLGDLSKTFIVLGFGYGLAFIANLFELSYQYRLSPSF